MKRSKIQLEAITDIENCKRAILNASRGKRKRNKVMFYIENIEEYAKVLSEYLSNPNSVFRDGSKAVKVEGTKKKERELRKPYFFPEHCAHWAIMQVIMPDLTKGFYNLSCASIKGRGTHYAKRAVESILKKDMRNTKYCMQIDIKSFYASISKDTLINLLGMKFKDRRIVAILAKIIRSYKGDGLPIGFYSSAPLANFYLTQSDHYIKETLQIKYMVRYMDDMIMYDSNKRKLHKVRQVYLDYIFKTRHLNLKQNWQVYKMPYCKKKPAKDEKYKERKRATDFIGFKFYRYKTTIRKSIFSRIKRCVIQLRCGKYTIKLARRFFSYWSYIVNTNSVKFKQKYIDGNINIKKLRELIRNESRSRNALSRPA